MWALIHCVMHAVQNMCLQAHTRQQAIQETGESVIRKTVECVVRQTAAGHASFSLDNMAHVRVASLAVYQCWALGWGERRKAS